jgi:hypothetical protein
MRSLVLLSFLILLVPGVFADCCGPGEVFCGPGEAPHDHCVCITPPQVCSQVMGFCPPTAIAGETCSWGASCSDIQCGCVYASEDNQKKSTFYESGGVCYHDCLVKCDDDPGGWERGSCSNDGTRSCPGALCTENGWDESACCSGNCEEISKGLTWTRANAGDGSMTGYDCAVNQCVDSGSGCVAQGLVPGAPHWLCGVLSSGVPAFYECDAARDGEKFSNNNNYCCGNIYGGAHPYDFHSASLPEDTWAASGSCNDGSDNDCDGLFDCADTDCAGDPACCTTTDICGNGQDDDCDGLTDTDDPDCCTDPGEDWLSNWYGDASVAGQYCCGDESGEHSFSGSRQAEAKTFGTGWQTATLVTNGNNYDVCCNSADDCVHYRTCLAPGSTLASNPDWVCNDESSSTPSTLYECAEATLCQGPKGDKECYNDAGAYQWLSSVPSEGGSSECSDGLDNDCDGEEDYDSYSTPNKGDSGCAVSVSSCFSSDSSPEQGETFTVSCTASPANVNSIDAIASSGGSCSFTGWSGSDAEFTCSFTSTGSKTVTCTIDSTKSYQSGNNRVCSLNVQTPSCSGSPASRNCGTDLCGIQTQICSAGSWTYTGATCVGDTSNYVTISCTAPNSCGGTCRDYCEPDGSYDGTCDYSCTTSDNYCDHDCNSGTPNICQAASCPGCGMCGDGTVDSGEQCDLGSGNGACPRTCSASCTLNSCGTCGNGVIEASEECEGSYMLTSPGLGAGNSPLTLTPTTDTVFTGTYNNGGTDYNVAIDVDALTLEITFASNGTVDTNCSLNFVDPVYQCMVTKQVAAGGKFGGVVPVSTLYRVNVPDFNGASCSDYGASAGYLLCSGCAIDSSGCTDALELEVTPVETGSLSQEFTATVLAPVPSGNKYVCDYQGCAADGTCLNKDPFGDASQEYFCMTASSSCTFTDTTLSRSGTYTYSLCAGGATADDTVTVYPPHCAMSSVHTDGDDTTGLDSSNAPFLHNLTGGADCSLLGFNCSCVIKAEDLAYTCNQGTCLGETGSAICGASTKQVVSKSEPCWEKAECDVTALTCASDFTCHYTNAGSWEWYAGLAPMGIETACADGADNDCDGLRDGDDPDCTSSLFGVVKDLQGNPLYDVTVTVLLDPSICPVCSNVTVPDSGQAYYQILKVPAGTHDVQAVIPGYLSQTKTITFPSQTAVEQDWQLSTSACLDCLTAGRCDVECSDSPLCDGPVHPVCNDSRPGWRPYNETMEIECCTGENRTLPSAGRPSYDCDSDELAIFSKIQQTFGKSARWEFIFCEKQE